MNILITGVAGFIGHNLALKLLSQGHTVYGLDLREEGTVTHSIHPSYKQRFFFECIDVSDEPTLYPVLKTIQQTNPIDQVWHLAANSDIASGVNDPNVDLKNTFMTTYTLLHAMRRLQLRKIIFASSSAVYGIHQSSLAEDSGPLFPISNYGAMKLASEAVITAACESFLDHAYLLRFPNVVGTPATHGVIFDLIQKLKIERTHLNILGNGEQQKPYLHVHDLIDAMLFITMRSQEKINCYNIGPKDEGAKVKEIARAVTDQVAPLAEHRFELKEQGWIGDVPRVRYNTQKLTQLGWQPSLSSLEAVALAVKEIAKEQMNA